MMLLSTVSVLGFLPFSQALIFAYFMKKLTIIELQKLLYYLTVDIF